jgi:ribosomal protein L33
MLHFLVFDCEQVVSLLTLLPTSIKSGKRTKSMVSKSTLQSSECKLLVIWGTNLSSTVRSGSLTKQEREMMKFSPFQLSVIVGLILSDGYLAYSNKRAKTARLVFEQSLAHSQYF